MHAHTLWLINIEAVRTWVCRPGLITRLVLPSNYMAGARGLSGRLGWWCAGPGRGGAGRGGVRHLEATRVEPFT
ncbi:hypothetical protein E2C01_051475 [Portunus trituberculatus]|uniref:Uncharacterized protein n=1 Tax=Portunus trituberculatus TaxID=210409 RepID=A0A5B7GLV8_PORTR|nr:hypothetical protein [Portunus trituberculatus]